MLGCMPCGGPCNQQSAVAASMLQNLQLRYGAWMPSVDRTLAPATTGATLRRLRKQAGRTVREVSEALGWSSSKLSRLETEHSFVKPEDLERLLDVYGVPDTVRRDLAATIRQSSPRQRRAADALPDTYERYNRLESRARRISMYGSILIPGLLQTAEYANAVITAGSDEQLVKARMEARMLRQMILGQRPPTQLSVVLDEAALRRPIGGPDVMRRQMIRLQELNDHDEISIRVLPFGIGAHPALTGHFAILDFPDGAGIPPAVFCDGLTGGVLRSKVDEVHAYRDCFAALEELALDSATSAAIFAAFDPTSGIVGREGLV
jgi:transcriptional regulator with XRE-family HTH domain